MTSIQASSSPLFNYSSAPPAPRQRRDSNFSLTQSSPMLSSYLLTPTLAAAGSPALLSYPSPFYSSASIFQPLQSPFMSPLPSHPPMLDISTPTQLTLTPSTSAASSATAADMQLPPSALSSSSAAAASSSSASSSTDEQSDSSPSSSASSSPSHSLLYASSSFPFNSHQAAILTHHEDAMLAADDDDDDDDEDGDESSRLIGGGGGKRKKKSISLLSHIVDGDASRSPLHSSALELMEETPTTPNSRPSSPSDYSSTDSEASRDEDSKRAAPHTSRAGRVSKPSARSKRQSSPARTPRAKKEKLSSHISSTASTSSEQSDAPSTPTSVTSHSSHSFSSAPTVMTAAEMAKEQTGGSGLSCHQCKTRKQLDELYTCGNYERKKRATGDEKKAIKPCRKKYCARCFPESDTRVLTNTGFLFLADIEARIDAGQQVLYACYDTSMQAIVYRPGQLVLVAPPTRWVDFTHAGTRRLWDATSDDYGSTVAANGVPASRLTLRTTPDHDMYVQLCTQSGEDEHGMHEPRMAEGAPAAPHKQTAQELAPGYQCDCDSAGRTCTHGYSHYRMYTGAASGLHTPADVISLTNSDRHLPVAALGLQSQDELAAFLELFGYWLGNGFMSYDTRADLNSRNAVCFALRKDRGSVYLRDLLARLRLEHGQHYTSSETDLQLVVRVTEPRWFCFFDNEFGVKQRMYSTQRRPSTSTASTVSASSSLSLTRARSFSESASVELVADYSGDEDTSPCEADFVDNEDDSAASSKWLPDWSLSRLSAEQLRLVIEGLRQADGCLEAGGKAMQGVHQICAVSVGFRDQLIQACMHAGYSAYFELNTAAGELCGYHAVPFDKCIYTAEEKEAAVQADSARQFKPICGSHDSWSVCYSETVSELLPAQDVRFDGSASSIRQRSGQTIQQQQAAVIATEAADLYDQKRDGRVWCVDVQHDDHLIFVQRAHRSASGIVTKVGRPMITGNCLHKFYGEQPPPRRANGTTVLEFECPSCRLICQCAACRKRQQLAEIAAGGGGGQQDSDEVDKADGGQTEEEMEAAVGGAESDMIVEEESTGGEAMKEGTAAETDATATAVSDALEPSVTSLAV